MLNMPQDNPEDHLHRHSFLVWIPSVWVVDRIFEALIRNEVQDIRCVVQLIDHFLLELVQGDFIQDLPESSDSVWDYLLFAGYQTIEADLDKFHMLLGLFCEWFCDRSHICKGPRSANHHVGICIWRIGIEKLKRSIDKFLPLVEMRKIDHKTEELDRCCFHHRSCADCLESWFENVFDLLLCVDC